MRSENPLLNTYITSIINRLIACQMELLLASLSLYLVCIYISIGIPETLSGGELIAKNPDDQPCCTLFTILRF